MKSKIDKKPIIYGIGLGPGDPELITLKALRFLQRADIVVYPASKDVPSIVRSIADQYIPTTCQEICIEIPMDEDSYTRLKTYEPYVKRIISAAQEGLHVVILCEGDPLFYGSFSYIYDAVSELCQVEIVPGVPSICAAGAVFGQSLARKEETITIIPAMLSEKTIETHLMLTNNAVIIKLGRHFKRIYALLEAMQLLDQAYYAERIGFKDEKICRLNECDTDYIPYFSLILVKDIVKNHD